MNLKNERPSMLHSMILNFALNYSKTHSDFKFYNFFLLWNPDNLRHEDLHDGHKDGKSIPSLISRICREFANSNIGINIEDLLSKINLRQETVLDFSEKPFFGIFSMLTRKTGFPICGIYLSNITPIIQNMDNQNGIPKF